ncbi:MAG TPA: Ig-like domain repeat protein [Candidatus Thermoplasmatota archaeon]|nr:Ig-like domain repeat protein [Candidatus Thermoplasmatota archaeon]
MSEEVVAIDWRIIAAALAALGVLAGGTLLTAQVQGDLDAGVQSRVRDTSFQPPQDTPLKLNDFKLPKDVALELPPGTTISPDLSKLTLPKDMDLQLPSDLDLSGLDFELPEDFDLTLPPGSGFSPPGLTLPEGATITLPDGRQFTLPDGSDLKLPPELVDRLLQQGLPAGALADGGSFPIRGLPPDLHATLDPPQFDGKGSLHLPAGTEITLPNGQKLPFAAGALAYAARYLLPAGTTFDFPFDATSGGGAFPVPTPTGTQPHRGATDDRVAVDTEITGMPSRVRKGEPVVVSGYVREAATGRAIPGAPVDVFMNESKRVPGVLVGTGTSDARGAFSIRLELPSDKPAREYQLVDHAVAFVGAGGRSFADGWGDPPFATFASTELSLDLPVRDGLGSPTTISGFLVDNTGAGVPSATVAIQVDGTTIARVVTSSTGRFGVQYTFSAGEHAVVASFAGTSNYEGSTSVKRSISIEDYAIEIEPVLRARPGDGIQLAGRVYGRGAIAPGRTVLIEGLFGAPAIRLVADDDARFSYAFTTSASQAPGVYTVRYTILDVNVSKTQIIELDQTGRIGLTAPSTSDVDEPIPISVALLTAEGVGIEGQSIRLTLSGPGGSREVTSVTDARGRFSLDMSPLRQTAGPYVLSARVVDSPNLDAPTVTQTLTLASFDVTWSVPSTVVRGQDMVGSATVRFAGKPLANAALTLNAFGPMQLVTNATGVASWTTNVPGRATLGSAEITLQAADHAQRKVTTRVVSVPKLSLDTPRSFDVGTPVETSLTLTDDQGEPIRNSAVTLIATTAEGVDRTIAVTDASGRWSGPLNLTSTPGNVTLAARFDPVGPYLAAEGVRTMSAVAPRAPGGDSKLLWLLPAIGLALLGGGAATYAYLQKRRTVRVPVQEATAVAPVLLARPTDVELRFAIPLDEPAVWGVGEPIEIVARNHAEAANVALRWGSGASEVYLAEDAEARSTLTFHEEGEVKVEAQRLGGDHAPSSASLRIVDYRKETAREFDLFLDEAQRIDGALTRRSTPREIAWTLEARLGDDARESLEEIALVLEVTNYSHYAVTREHYLRFVRAARALDRFLVARPREA